MAKGKTGPRTVITKGISPSSFLPSLTTAGSPQVRETQGQRPARRQT